MGSTVTAPGTYQQYKNDTAIFLTWISQATQACGWTSVIPGTPDRAPNRFSHSSTTPQRRQTRVREIIEQARCIVGCTSPALHLPQAIVGWGKRAISTRRSFTNRLSNLDSSTVPNEISCKFVGSEVNESHEFFTNSLQEALDLLEKRYVSTALKLLNH